MKLDYTIIKDLNPKRIIFLDASEYNTAPISPTLHVKFPDFDKIYSTPIQFGEINILNTSRLQFADCNIEFQDGPYCFNFETNNKSCEYKRKEYITTQAYAELDELLNGADLTNKNLLEKITKIWIYLQGAESTVNTDENAAHQLYKQALNLLNCNNGLRMSKSKQQCSSC